MNLIEVSNPWNMIFSWFTKHWTRIWYDNYHKTSINSTKK